MEGSMAKLNLIIPAVEHARLLGDILHQFTALKATTPSLTEVVRTVKTLELKLRDWHDSLPPELRTDVESSGRSGDLDLVHVLYHHYAFWGSLITIHSILVHPWNAPGVQTEPIELLDFRNHSRNSMKKVVDASRAIIRSLRHVHIDVCSPKWSENPLSPQNLLLPAYFWRAYSLANLSRSVFTYPLTAFMNLFIYILQDPTMATVQSGLDALYQVCGLFSYLEYNIPEMSFTFPREATNLARSVVTKAKILAARTTDAGAVSQSDLLPAAPMTASNSELPGLDDSLLHAACSNPQGVETQDFRAEKFHDHRDQERTRSI